MYFDNGNDNDVFEWRLNIERTYPQKKPSRQFSDKPSNISYVVHGYYLSDFKKWWSTSAK